MTNFFRILIFTLVVGLFWPFHVSAGTQIDVVFEKTPLFAETNLAPGHALTRFVKVKNKTSAPLPIAAQISAYTPAVGAGVLQLSDVMMLNVEEGGHVYFTGTLTQFFQLSELALGTLQAGEEKTFHFNAEFKLSSGNYFQAKTAQFDIKIGVVSNPPSGGGGGVTASSGGGGVVLTSNFSGQQLSIFNVHQTLPNETTGFVTWQTTMPANSKIVFDVAKQNPILNTSDSKLGYAYVLENTDKATTHFTSLTGLQPGTKYAYRISAGDNNQTFTEERYFTTANAPTPEPTKQEPSANQNTQPQKPSQNQNQTSSAIPTSSSTPPASPSAQAPSGTIGEGTSTPVTQPDVQGTSTVPGTSEVPAEECTDNNWPFLFGELLYLILTLLLGYYIFKKDVDNWKIYPLVLGFVSVVWWFVFPCREPWYWLVLNVLLCLVCFLLLWKYVKKVVKVDE